jgi:alkylhydroperoxidase family enzyme
MPVFIQHTLESAPPGSRRSMAAVRDHLGFLPAATALWAHETSGDVGDEALRAFLDAGYTARNALEAMLGIGTYTMSTFANRLTRAPVDEALTSSGGQPT